MVFDFIVMALSTWKLAWKGLAGVGRVVGGRRRSIVGSGSGRVQMGQELVTGPGRLANLIFGDGLIFFFIASVIFSLLDISRLTRSCATQVPLQLSSHHIYAAQLQFCDERNVQRPCGRSIHSMFSFSYVRLGCYLVVPIDRSITSGPSANDIPDARRGVVSVLHSL